MAERIEHTPYEWVAWRRRVVLFKRVSLKPLWGLCVFAAGYLALASSVVFVIALIMGDTGDLRVPILSILPVGVIAFFFFRSFMKVFRDDKGFLMPRRLIRVGAGQAFRCETLRLPQPTSMGGTLPGGPTRWLVLTKQGGKAVRLIQVYHDLDLLKLNLALAGQAKSGVSPSH